MPNSFVFSEGIIERIEAKLAAADPILRRTAGQAATMHWRLENSPGRRAELRRRDGVTVAVIICPLTISDGGTSTIFFAVKPMAWIDVGEQRLGWRRGQERTIDLSTPEGISAAGPVIETAWQEALAVSRAEVEADAHTPPPIPEA